MDTAAVLQKVRNLRRLAASTTSLHEAQTAAAQADALIQKHRLTEVELKEQAPVGVFSVDLRTTRLRRWKRTLLIALAEHYGCICVRERAAADRMLLVGRANDVELAQYMYAWLSVEAQRLSQRLYRTAADRLSFCVGATTGFILAMRRAAQQVASQHASAAMVLRARVTESEAWALKNIQMSPTKRAVQAAYRRPKAYQDGCAHGEDLHAQHQTKALPA